MKSTLADSDVLRAKVVYPIDLPFCKINDDIFKNASIIHVIYDFKVYSCQLLYKGKMLIPGEMILLSTNASGYHVTIIDKGMSSELAEKYLNEINVAAIKMVDKPHLELAKYLTQVVNEEIITDFEVPMVFAPELYGENNPDFGLEDPGFVADADNDVRGKYKNRWNINHFRWNTPSVVNPMNIYSFVPFPKLANAFEKIFKSQEIDVFGSFLQKCKKDRIILNNERTLDGNFKHSVKCKMRKQDQQVLWRNNDNHPTAAYYLTFSTINSYLSNYDTAIEFGAYSWSTGMSWQAFTAPQIPDFPNLKCEYLIEMNLFLYLHQTSMFTVISVEIWMYPPNSSQSFFSRRTDFTPPEGSLVTYNLQFSESVDMLPGTQIYFVLRHRGVGGQATHPGNTTIGVIQNTKESYIEIKNVTLDLYNAGESNFELNKHMPEMTVGEFLNSIRQMFGVVFYSNHNTREFEMSNLEDLFNSNEYVDLSNYLIPDSFEKIFNEITPISFRYKHEIETTENPKWPSVEVDNFSDLTQGNPGDRIAVLADGMVYEYKINLDLERYEWTPMFPYSKTVNDKAEISEIGGGVLANTNRINKLIPITSAKGISEKFATDGANSLGFLYYKGLKLEKESTDKRYPFATSYNHDANGNELDCLPLFESGKNSNGETNTLPYLQASNNFEQSKALFKIPLCVVEELFQLLQPQRNSNAKRKIMLNSVKFIPITMSFNIDSSAEYIETEIIMIKNAR